MLRAVSSMIIVYIMVTLATPAFSTIQVVTGRNSFTNSLNNCGIEEDFENEATTTSVVQGLNFFSSIRAAVTEGMSSSPDYFGITTQSGRDNEFLRIRLSPVSPGPMPNKIVITLPSPTGAVGFELAKLNCLGSAVNTQMTINGQTVDPVVQMGRKRGFIGFVSDAIDISTIEFHPDSSATDGSDKFFVMKIRYNSTLGDCAPTP